MHYFTKGSSLDPKYSSHNGGLSWSFCTSPSGLVFCWTLNNTFLWLKPFSISWKHPGKVLNILFSAAGVVLLVYGLFFYKHAVPERMALFVGCGVLFQLPLAYSLLKKEAAL